MSATAGRPLRLALLDHDFDLARPSEATPMVRGLAGALSELGHEPTVIACHRGMADRSRQDGFELIRVRVLPEAPLRARGFAGPLTQIPFTLDALRRGGYDVVHAFTTVDAQAALLSRRRGGGPVVFTPTIAPTRNNLADRRLRLTISARAFRESDAVVAPTEEIRRGINRWLALEVEHIAPDDARAYAAVYGRCVARLNPRG